MDDLLALDGGGAATAWQKKHAKRKRLEAQRAARAVLRAEQQADIKKRTKKWRARWLAEVARCKAEGLPLPTKHGRPRDIKRSNMVDMVGWRFGRLTVLRVAPTSKNGGQRCRTWWCRCDCGSPEKRVNGTSLRQGNVQSCGCWKRERVREAFAEKRAERAKLAAAPFSIQIAELRHRIFKKQHILRRDTALLDAVRQVLVQDEVRQGVRRISKAGRAMLVQPAGVKAAHGGRPKKITTVH